MLVEQLFSIPINKHNLKSIEFIFLISQVYDNSDLMEINLIWIPEAQ